MVELSHHIPTLEEAEWWVGSPIRSWEYRSFLVARKLGDLLGIQCRTTSGVWTGPHYTGLSHGWLTLEDGTVLDPTRWALTHEDPYIYHGPSDFYKNGKFIDWDET